jgi:hypothetical protein
MPNVMTNLPNSLLGTTSRSIWAIVSPIPPHPQDCQVSLIVGVDSRARDDAGICNAWIIVGAIIVARDDGRMWQR